MNIKLPDKICILDLETAHTNFKNPEKCKIAFVGIKIYNLHNNRYYPCKHIYFFPNQITDLEKLLRGFKCIIIGHNIYGFDFRVLNPLMSLKGIVKKTIDTQFFIFNKNPSPFKGTSLDLLSQTNFGKRKTLKGKDIPKLWREGKHKRVIKYNENDLKLTYNVWWILISKQSIRVKYYNKQSEFISELLFKFSRKDLLYLVGKRPLFNYNTWKRKIEIDGNITNIGVTLLHKDDNWKSILGIIPIEKCTKCKGENIVKEHINPSDLTEGQLAEYEANNWGVYRCQKCGNLMYYEGNIPGFPLGLGFVNGIIFE